MMTERTTLTRELAIVPRWAYALAAVLLAAAPIALLLLMQEHERNPPHPAFSIGFGLFAGSFLGLLVLAIGYVNADARRRGMNVTLWTLLAIFVPNALGFVLYFLLREPLRTPCPQCGEAVLASYNYCPRCQHSLKPVCRSCGKPVAAMDRFCAHCGQGLPS